MTVNKTPIYEDDDIFVYSILSPDGKKFISGKINSKYGPKTPIIIENQSFDGMLPIFANIHTTNASVVLRNCSIGRIPDTHRLIGYRIENTD